MNNIINYFKVHRNVFNFILLLCCIGISVGIILSFSLNSELSRSIYDYFIEYINNYKFNIFYYLFVITLLFISYISIFFVFIPFFWIFIENMSIGLIIGLLIKYSGLNGLLFSIIFILLTKFIYLIILYYFIISLYRFLYSLLKNIKSDGIKLLSFYKSILLKYFICFISLFIISIFNYYFIPKIINIFIFLL